MRKIIRHLVHEFLPLVHFFRIKEKSRYNKMM